MNLSKDWHTTASVKINQIILNTSSEDDYPEYSAKLLIDGMVKVFALALVFGCVWVSVQVVIYWLSL